MKKTLKRIGALLIAMVMVIAMCVPAMADITTNLNTDSPGYPTEGDKATVTVSGFTKGQVESVTAYQIVDAVYNEDGQLGFSGYVAVKDLIREATEANPSKADRVPIFGNKPVKNADGLTEYSYTVEGVTHKVYSGDNGTSYVDEAGEAATIPAGATPKVVEEFIAVYPTSKEISLLAEDPTILQNGVPMTTEDGAVYKADLTVGEWLVIATPAAGSDTVYNPMLVSVYYVVNEAGVENIAVDPISSTDNWDGKLETKDAYIKSTRPTIEKVITDNSRENPAQDSAQHGDDEAFGDTVKFQAKTLIPSYSEEYLAFVKEVEETAKASQSYDTMGTPIKFDITDKMEPGLNYDSTIGLEIIVGEEQYDGEGNLKAPAEKYTVTGTNTQQVLKKNAVEVTDYAFTYSVLKSNTEGAGKVYGFKIAFDQKYILAHDNWPVTVRYAAELTDKATVNYDPNENTVDVTYTIGTDPELEADGTFKQTVKYDENGNPIPKINPETGEPIPVIDPETNEPKLRTDEDGNPIPVLDENGNPVPKIDPVTNKPVPKIDPDTHEPIPVIDPLTGEPKIKTDPETGEPIQKVDPDTNEPVYDEDGNPVYEYETEVEYEYEIEYEYETENKYPENTLEDTTYQYTFEIDGDVYGKEAEEGNPLDPNEYENRTHELLKLNENGDVKTEGAAADNGATTTKDLENPLAGAFFSLTRIDEDADGEVYYAVSDYNGHFGACDELLGGKEVNGFKGLDTGIYELKEEKAPQGYTLNKATYTVIIDATYHDTTTDDHIKGTLDEYTITVINDKDFTEAELANIKNGTTKAANIPADKKNTTTHKATYTIVKTPAEKEGQEPTYELTGVTITDTAQASTFIKNTKLTNLPSTGGIGSYLFTIIGVAVMAIVAGSFFRSRAKMA